jgi:hypothetical protein
VLKKLGTFLSLFGSMSTLLCCALPALLVSLGAGATLVSLLGKFPQIIWVSEHKKAVFSFAAIMLTLSGLAQWNARHEPCPIDAAQARACTTARRTSLIIYTASLIIFLIGAGFALLPDLLAR